MIMSTKLLKPTFVCSQLVGRPLTIVTVRGDLNPNRARSRCCYGKCFRWGYVHLYGSFVRRVDYIVATVTVSPRYCDLEGAALVWDHRSELQETA